jgi:hypothetical protein
MHNQRPELCIHAGRSDRTAIPSRPLTLHGLRDRSHVSLMVGACVLRRTLLNPRLPLSRHLLVHLIDNQRKARFGISLKTGARNRGATSTTPSCSTAAGTAPAADTAEADVHRVA